MSETTPSGKTAVPAAGDAPEAAGTATLPGKSRGRLARRVAVVILIAAAIFAVWYFAIREPAPRNDLERFRGDWKLAVGGREAKEADEDAPPVVAIRVAGDRWAYVAGGKETKAYRIALNEAATPKQIDLALIETAGLRGAPVKMHGIYAFDGNKTVRVRVAPANSPRPTTFDDTGDVVWVMTKVKLEMDSQSHK